MVKIFGVIGHPVAHSLSPVMHNAVFRSLKIDANYFSFDVEKNELQDGIKGAKALKFSGLNVTIPHKISVMKYLDIIDESAKIVNAVNTIKFDNKKTIGYNTDGIGAIKAIKKRTEIEGKKIFIFGAGGAARSIIFSALSNNAEISVYNRTEEKVDVINDEVMKKLNKRIKKVNLNNLKSELENCEIIINATSVGMFPDVNESIIDEKFMPEGKIVMDIVYNPIETKFLKYAKKRNCITIDGVDMLVYQGAESLKIWLDIEIKDDIIKIMKDAVIKELKK